MLRSHSPLSRLGQALADQSVSPPPIWLMRQAGRYLPEYRKVRSEAASFLDLCLDPERAAEVTLQPLRRFDLDAAIVFSDILIVPYALGQKVDFVEGEGPRLDPMRDTASLARLEPTRAASRFLPVYETLARVRGALSPEIPVIGFCGAPWTVATYMVEGAGSKDQTEARTLAYRDPDTFQRLIDLLVEVSCEYLLGQVEAGASILQIFDSWAGSLPENEFARWCIEPTRAMVRRLKAAAPEIPVIGFPRGAGPLTEAYVTRTGVDALGCDTSLPLAWIRDRLQPNIAVQGNLDPVLLLAGGRRLDTRVAEILAALSGGPFVFNLGHGILPETPPEHVSRLVSLVKNG
jgi:uroporphyrinogen decarboxylase